MAHAPDFEELLIVTPMNAVDVNRLASNYVSDVLRTPYRRLGHTRGTAACRISGYLFYMLALIRVNGTAACPISGVLPRGDPGRGGGPHVTQDADMDAEARGAPDPRSECC